MRNISDLLNRFKSSLDKDSETREVVAKCIKDITGLDVKLADIAVKGATIRIKTSPAKKNSIKLEEAKILSAIRRESKLNVSSMLY